MAKEYKFDIEGKIDREQTRILFETLEAASADYDPESYVLIPNYDREHEYADCGWDLLHEYCEDGSVKLMRKTYSRMAAFRMIFKELNIDNTKRFMEIIQKADNITIESHVDGTTYIDITFHNYTKKVDL